MGTLARVLRDGLRLALLRRPRAVPLDAGFGHYALFFLAGLAIDIAWQLPLVEAPRAFETWGLQSALAGGWIRLACIALIVFATGRRALFWTAAAWVEVALCVVALVTGPLYVLDRQVEWPLGYYTWFSTLAWLLAILLRLSLWLGRDARLRAAAVALVAFVLHVGPWLVLEPMQYWNRAGEREFERAPGAGILARPEPVMYAQMPLLRRAVGRIAPGTPGRPELFAVLFGGDASEDVFRNEVEFAQPLLETRLGARNRVLALANHPERAMERPLATATNLLRGLRGVALRMNLEEDILLLYLTSHGSADHWLYVNQPPLPLDSISPQLLRRALDRSGIKWRVLVVSACYSGGYIDALRNENTLVITASRADRSSFGCGAESDITFFGDAFLAHALNETTDFTEAFRRASSLVEKWEAEQDYEPSHPQIHVGAAIAPKLEAWRATLPEAPRVEFTRRD